MMQFKDTDITTLDPEELRAAIISLLNAIKNCEPDQIRGKQMLSNLEKIPEMELAIKHLELKDIAIENEVRLLSDSFKSVKQIVTKVSDDITNIKSSMPSVINNNTKFEKLKEWCLYIVGIVLVLSIFGLTPSEIIHLIIKKV